MKIALDSLYSIYKDENRCYDFLLYDTLIYRYVPKLAAESDKIAFISATSVLKESLLYWKINFAKWRRLNSEFVDIGLPNEMVSKNTSENPMKEAAFADCAGAVTGTIAGMKVGLTGGTMTVPGVGTVVGGAAGVLVGAIGGAITGSAASGIHSAIKWIIDW